MKLTILAGHKYALLVFQTTTLLDFGAATGVAAADATKILLGSGPFGDFDPAGKFTTVTAFLNGKGKLLGTPIAGGYFTVMKHLIFGYFTTIVPYFSM